MPASKVKLLAHSLGELQEQHELLERRFEKVTRQNVNLLARVRTLEARVAELLEAGPPPAPSRKRRRP